MRAVREYVQKLDSLVVGGIGFGLFVLLFYCAHLPTGDGRALLGGAQNWWAGKSLYAHVDGAAANINLPHTFVIFLPFSHYPMAVWQIANVLAFAYCLYLVRRECEGSWLVVLAVLCSSPVTHAQIGLGQMSGFLTLLATWGWLGLRKDKAWQAGLAIAALIAIKPFFGLLGLLLFRRRQMVLWAVAGFLGSFALGIAVFGIRAYQEWFTITSSINWMSIPISLSWVAVVMRSIGEGTFYGDVPYHWWTWYVVGAGAGTISLASLWHLYRNWQDADYVFLLAFFTSLLIAPTGWIYYGWLAAGPVWALLARGWRPSPMVWLLWVPWPWLHQPDPWLAVTFGSVYFWGALGTWIGLLRWSESEHAVLSADDNVALPEKIAVVTAA